ncbi:hypothetical protein [Microseira wollei]|uniref:hypothetical protein n=1 Tax=Microseira wollei TaxID=467598 RepID=UPI001CFC5230|nr:hypothetical protein [Microseira wollei]
MKAKREPPRMDGMGWLQGFRKGDYVVEATQGAKTVCGWVSGDTEKQVSVSDQDWKRLGQFSKNSRPIDTTLKSTNCDYS